MSRILGYVKGFILKRIAENDPLLGKIWISVDEEKQAIHYGFNVNDIFGHPRLGVDRDLRILISTIESMPSERRPFLFIWIYDRDPTVPYTKTLAEIRLVARDKKIFARAEIPLRLPSFRAIRTFNSFLRRLGIREKLNTRDIEDFLIRSFREFISSNPSRSIRIRKIRKVRRGRTLTIVLKFELESAEFLGSSQLLEAINKILHPYEKFCEIIEMSNYLLDSLDRE